MISLVAVDENWGIGKTGDLPWSIPGEQIFFKETTMDGTVIMGRKTLDSLPGGRPLKGRRNIVLTRNPSFECHSAETVTTPEQLLGLIQNLDPEKVFLIGGAQIYRLLTPYCSKAYVTKVKGSFDVDTYHPDLDCDSDWRITDISAEVTSSNGITYTRLTYENQYFSRQL